MVSHLSEAAEILKEVRDFVQQPRLMAVCGTQFDALDTDFSALLEVNEYARRVRQALTGMDQASLAGRTLLLEGAAEQIDHVLALTTQAELLEALNHMVNSAADEDVSLTALITDMSAKRLAMQQLADQARDMGVLPIVQFGTLNDAVKVLNAREDARETLCNDSRLAELLGIATPAPDTSLHALEGSWALIRELTEEGIPQPAIDFIKCDNFDKRLDQLREGSRQVEEALDKVQTGIDALTKLCDLDWSVFSGSGDVTSHELHDIGSRLASALESEGDLQNWLMLRRAVMQASNSELHDVTAAYDELALPYENLAEAYDLVLYRSLAKQAFHEMPVLSEFSGATLQAARDRFRHLDKELIELERQVIAAELARRPVAQGTGVGSPKDYTDRALILHEVGKKRRHIPLRQLVSRAGAAIQQMKPCFMMSPLSVAQFLPPRSLTFDLLIIDEASQMRPEDAVGAVARAGQIVVVGDPKQLPPTSFFDRDAVVSEELEHDSN